MENLIIILTSVALSLILLKLLSPKVPDNKLQEKEIEYSRLYNELNNKIEEYDNRLTSAGHYFTRLDSHRHNTMRDIENIIKRLLLKIEDNEADEVEQKKVIKSIEPKIEELEKIEEDIKELEKDFKSLPKKIKI